MTKKGRAPKNNNNNINDKLENDKFEFNQLMDILNNNNINNKLENDKFEFNQLMDLLCCGGKI